MRQYQFLGTVHLHPFFCDSSCATTLRRIMDLWECAECDLLTCFAARLDQGRSFHCLGEGGQARVYGLHDGRINPHTGESMGPIAVKCYPRALLRENSVNYKRVQREIVNHRRLSHKHIVGFREVRLTQNFLFISLDYIRGRSLWQRMEQMSQPLGEDAARWCFQQLILAVDYLHQMKIANRDISLENILVNESNDDKVSIMLCDLGLSRNQVSLENNKTRSIVGKFGYLAPEVLIRMDRKSFDLARAGDIYACGVCLYKMLYGVRQCPLHVPDYIDNSGLQNLIVELVCATEEMDLGLDKCQSPHVSSGCIAFLRKVLHTNPKQRISMNQIWKDPWFLQDLPPHHSRDYNYDVSNESYVDEHCSYLQSEVDLRNKVQRAASDYQLKTLWE